jgi:hypothetical protein
MKKYKKPIKNIASGGQGAAFEKAPPGPPAKLFTIQKFLGVMTK